MVINGPSLLKAAPIKDMLDHKVKHNGVSHGLTECGYDIRIKQEVWFWPPIYHHITGEIRRPAQYQIEGQPRKYGSFALASSMECFDVPNDLMGHVLNKSTWARVGLDASRTTNLEPGWSGHLTLELTFNGPELIHVPAGSGIAQVIFHQIAHPAAYTGKYANQADEPVASIFE
jgi:dCTP deaminase